MVCCAVFLETFAGRIYSNFFGYPIDRGLPRLNNIFFVATQTRSIWIILITLSISWFTHSSPMT